MTLSQHNHIHMQSRYVYIVLIKLNYPGRVENQVLHNTTPPALKYFDKVITYTEVVVF